MGISTPLFNTTFCIVFLSDVCELWVVSVLMSAYTSLASSIAFKMDCRDNLLVLRPSRRRLQCEPARLFMKREAGQSKPFSLRNLDMRSAISRLFRSDIGKWVF